MILWRIAAETRQYKCDDLSGMAAARNPGRWNEAGQPVVYAALTMALAVLETTAHIDDGGLPLNRFLVQIEVPASIWRKRRELDIATLPPNWSAIPAGATSVGIGAAWLAERTSPLLLVPSVILPEDRVALINPLHPDAHHLHARTVRPFEYSRLFRPSKK